MVGAHVGAIPRRREKRPPRARRTNRRERNTMSSRAAWKAEVMALGTDNSRSLQEYIFAPNRRF